ncbi:uncharacterized protein LOC127879184 [Dreissena polymorpha]|uniref:Uncharacterized protein n=1 Tax=Dreissena polymorpha TaxID=45954 RepID=A0A9D4HED6_DREPO|nr:uncharacterized protein LOC127879184 [Dreissena polymorpha]KAH3831941.1 hypothetical protein DPMN_105214 [Dreissena polymorpha]
MQPEVKLSSFMFHLKFSKTDDYVHEHELYELMRSRNLYQTQFGVRLNFRKTIRNIQKDEKQQRYHFENNRKIFVQKRKERQEAADRLRLVTATKLGKLSVMKDPKPKPTRTYVPLPQSTVVYTDLPEIQMPLYQRDEEEEEVAMPSDENTQLPLTAPSPSMVTTALTGRRKKSNGTMLGLFGGRPVVSSSSSLKTHELLDVGSLAPTAKVLVAGRRSHRTLTITVKSKATSRQDESECDSSDTMSQLMVNDELLDELRSLRLDSHKKFVKENKFELTAKLDHEKSETSTSYVAKDILPKLNSYGKLTSESKAKIWAEKHGIHTSKADIIKDQDYQRLLIDRPSKWAMTHHGDLVQSKILDMRMRYSREMLNANFKKKSRQLERLSEKLMLKSRLSLPELDTMPKPMTTMDPGGTTPDGRLILTKADFDAYLANYRKARDIRLQRTKQRNKLLLKKIENFNLQPNHCLKDEARLRASLRTI